MKNIREASLPFFPHGIRPVSTFFKNIQKRTVLQVLEPYIYAQAIIETMHEPLLMLDKRLRVKVANKSFFKTFHLTEKAVYNRHIYELGKGSWDNPALQILLEKILPKNTFFHNYRMIYRFKDKDKTLHLNARRITFGGRKTELILLVFGDITQFMQIEEELRNSKDQLELILQGVADSITVLDTKDRFLYANDVAVKALGYTSLASLLKVPFSRVMEKFEIMDEERKSVPLNKLPGPRALAGEKKPSALLRFRVKKTGKVYWALGKARPVLENHKKVKFAINIFSDITDRIQLEKRKDEFINIASHELKTPLTVMKGYAQILEKRLLKSKDKNNLYFASRIAGQVDRLVNLVNDFLSVRMIEEGKITYHKRALDLDQLVKKTIIDFQYTQDSHQIIKRGEIKDKIFGDEERIRGALINLITNAIKYSPNAEKIVLHIFRDKETVVIGVEDFGIGIKKEDQARVFERFYRTEERDIEKIPGFGLGLYICSEIIKHHQGKMWVTSKKGKGSTFYISLPILKKDRKGKTE